MYVRVRANIAETKYNICSGKFNSILVFFFCFWKIRNRIFYVYVVLRPICAHISIETIDIRGPNACLVTFIYSYLLLLTISNAYANALHTNMHLVCQHNRYYLAHLLLYTFQQIECLFGLQKKKSVFYFVVFFFFS